MKKFLFLTLLLFCGVFAFSQSKMACCAKPSATQQFAMLASNKEFIMAHKNPLKMRFQSSIGKTITYKTSDGKEASAYELKTRRTTDNYILFIHEYWGLNDFVKKES